MPERSELGKLASAATKEEFAEKLSSYTSLTSKEIEDIFPEESDREELVELIDVVNSSADENNKKAELAGKIGKVSGAIIKLGKKLFNGL